MNEDFNSKAWIDNRARPGKNILSVGRDILLAFERLAALHYAAPWTVERLDRQARCAVDADCL